MVLPLEDEREQRRLRGAPSPSLAPLHVDDVKPDIDIKPVIAPRNLADLLASSSVNLPQLEPTLARGQLRLLELVAQRDRSILATWLDELGVTAAQRKALVRSLSAR